jgi:hypothetical protein
VLADAQARGGLLRDSYRARFGGGGGSGRGGAGPIHRRRGRAGARRSRLPRGRRGWGAPPSSLVRRASALLLPIPLLRRELLELPRGRISPALEVILPAASIRFDSASISSYMAPASIRRRRSSASGWACARRPPPSPATTSFHRLLLGAHGQLPRGCTRGSGVSATGPLRLRIRNVCKRVFFCRCAFGACWRRS